MSTAGAWQRQIAYEATDKRPPYNVWNIIGNTGADERKHSVVATTITDDDDARAIAAVPVLLAALRAICRELEYAHGGAAQMPTLDLKVYETASAALAEALPPAIACPPWRL